MSMVNNCIDMDQQLDKMMRVNCYLMEKYGSELWKDFGMEKTGDKLADMQSAMKMLDMIYEQEKKKYPLMWYEYCLYS